MNRRTAFEIQQRVSDSLRDSMVLIQTLLLMWDRYSSEEKKKRIEEIYSSLTFLKKSLGSKA